MGSDTYNMNQSSHSLLYKLQTVSQHNYHLLLLNLTNSTNTTNSITIFSIFTRYLHVSVYSFFVVYVIYCPVLLTIFIIEVTGHMDRGGGLDYKTKTGPVNMFGQRIHVPSDGPNKPKFEIPEV